MRGLWVPLAVLGLAPIFYFCFTTQTPHYLHVYGMEHSALRHKFFAKKSPDLTNDMAFVYELNKTCKNTQQASKLAQNVTEHCFAKLKTDHRIILTYWHGPTRIFRYKNHVILHHFPTV